MRKIWTSLLALFLCSPMFSQTPGSSWRLRTIVTDTAWTKLDTLTIIPSSIAFKNISGKDLTFDDYILNNQSIKFKTKGDSISVSYRVLPFDLGKPYFKIDTQYINQPLDKILIPYNPFAQEQKLPDFGKLNYNGTFSRGVSFGNSQNLVLNSNLNLQMTGRLTNDIEVLASVSDNSIPLQPEGNTAQLQEFDKVYIQLKRGQSSLTAGDYELGRPDGYFLNYFKKLQGARNRNSQSKRECDRPCGTVTTMNIFVGQTQVCPTNTICRQTADCCHRTSPGGPTFRRLAVS